MGTRRLATGESREVTRRTLLAGAAAAGMASFVSPGIGLAAATAERRTVFTSSLGGLVGTSGAIRPGRSFALAGIEWPDSVAGCALAQEIVVLPPEAEADLGELPDDPAQGGLRGRPAVDGDSARDVAEVDFLRCGGRVGQMRQGLGNGHRDEAAARNSDWPGTGR